MKTLLTGITALTLASAASAGTSLQDLIIVDLTVPNQITVNATSGLASASSSFSNFTGFYLFGAFDGSTSGFASTGVPGATLTTFNNPADGTPLLFRSGTNTGLNIWSFSTDATVSVTAGQQAFTGSATWTLSPANYAALLTGASSGNLYANADTDDDLQTTGVLIGTWSLIPTPGTAGLLGLAGLAAVRRRR